MVVIVGCQWKYLCHDLSLKGWYKRNLPWQAHCFEILTKENWWPSLWAIADCQFVVGIGYDHMIFLMRFFWFGYIWIEVKDWWSDRGYGPPDSSFMKTFIEYFFVVSVKDSVDCWLYELIQIKRVFNSKFICSPTMSFDQNMFCCVIVCNHFNCFIDHNSQLNMFLKWQIVTVFNCDHVFLTLT